MARRRKGVVASGHACVTEAACEILRAGGNAFDAAIGAGFAASVAEPALTSLGGGGFLLARSAEKQTILFDFFVDTPGRGLTGTKLEPHFEPVSVQFPSSTQIFNVGLGSVAVPANLLGFLHVHRRLGRLPLTEILAPSIALARAGVIVNPFQAYLLDLLEPILTLTATGRALFAPSGKLLRAGERFTNPDLALFLETLPGQGGDEFYHGALAAIIARDMVDGQGLLGAEDLAAYNVIERQPLVVDYRGVRLLTNPPPSFGGSLLALSLALLSEREIALSGFGGDAHLDRLIEVMAEVDRRRDAYLQQALAGDAAQTHRAARGTTHISVCDGAGNVASMTTSNGEGSGYIVPGTGIMLNNMMGEDDLHPQGFHSSPPGQRVASMMAPSLLLEDDRVRLVLGSGGSKRIRTALLQVISNTVDFAMPANTAVSAPRMHWDGEQVQVESGFDSDVLARLQTRWPLNVWQVQDLYFGGVHAVAPPETAVGDPRRGGFALAVDCP